MSKTAQDLNRAFLVWLFGPDTWRRAWITTFQGDPGERAEAKWAGGRAELWINQTRPENNNYFSVGMFAERSPAQRATDTKGTDRCNAAFEALHVLAIDDVGTKVGAAQVLNLLGVPSWELETSPGNYQWGYKLKPTVTALALVKLVQHQLVDVLLGQRRARDPGQNNVGRYMRLPFGTNGKAAYAPGGFQTKLTETRWNRTLELGSDLLLKIDQAWSQLPPDPRGTGTRPGAGTSTGTSGSSFHDPDPEELPKADLAAQVLQDPVIQAFEVLGLIQNGPRGSAMGRGWDVTCPWVGEHTGRMDTGAFLTLTAAFKCHHGHCADRTADDLPPRLSEMLEEDSDGLVTLAGLAFPDPPPAPSPGLYAAPSDPEEAAFFDRLVFHTADNAFVNVTAPRERGMSPEAFDSAYSRLLGPEGLDLLPLRRKGGAAGTPIRPRDWYLGHPRMRTVEGRVWLPGKGRIVRVGQRDLLNTYQGHRRRAEMGQLDQTQLDQGIRLWLALAEHVLPDPDVRAVILDWLALLLARPGTKPGWHVLLWSEAHGVGKDMLIEPLHVLLPHASTMASPNHLGRGFNTWAANRLVHFKELRRTSFGRDTGHDQYSMLKETCENTSALLSIEPKGRDPYPARNVCGIWITSNEGVALPIQANDRRFLVYEAEAGAWSFGQELHAWLHAQGGAELVGEWLYRRWDTMDQARRDALVGHAPMTSAKQDLIRASRHPFEGWFEDEAARDPQIDKAAMSDVVTAQEIADRYARAPGAGSGRYGNGGLGVDRIKGLLRQVNAARLNGGRQVRLGPASQVRLWAVRNADIYANMTEAELRDLYLKTRGQQGVGSH